MYSTLKNKTAVITGGANGIGLQIASRLGLEGVRIALLDRDREAANYQAAILRSKGVDVVYFTLDITDHPSVNLVFEKIGNFFGNHIDILVNSAGIAVTGSIEEISISDWEKTLSVNVTGCFLCSREVIPFMKEHGGKIINIASVAGKVGIPQMAAYCCSKSAVIGLTRQMAIDYAPKGICVNCVCPGTVAETNMGKKILNEDITLEEQQKRLSKYPIGRFAKVDEIASAVLFLASQESNFVCGTELVVDGGMTAI